MSEHVRNELKRGARVNALGVVGKIAGPSFLIVVTRLYGADAFGVYITAVALVEMAIAFLTAGFKDAALMYVARHADEEGAGRPLYQALVNAFGWSFLFFAVLIAVTLVVAPVVLPRFFDYGDRLLTMINWMVLALPLMAFDRIVLAATQGLKIMKYEALVNGGLRPVLLLALSTAFYFVAPDVRGLTIAYVATQAAAALAAIVIYRRELSWQPLWEAARNFHINRELIRFAIPQNLNLALDRFLTNIDVLMLGLLGMNARLVGFYGAGALIVRELRHIKLVFSGAFAPHIVRMHRRREFSQLAHTLANTARWIATLVIPALLALAVLRSDLLAIVSPAFIGSEAFFMLLLLPIPYLQCSFGLAGNAVVMTGHSRLNLMNNVISGSLNLALNLWLIPSLGLTGAAIASSLAMLVKAIFEITEMRYVVGVPLLVSKLYKPHLAGLLAGGALVAASLAYTAPLGGSFWYRLILAAGAVLLYGAVLTLLQGRLPGIPIRSPKQAVGS